VRSRRERLEAALLYLVCDDRDEDFLEAALRGGVDIVQLRMKQSAAADVVAAGRRFKRVCDEHGALLLVNDRPDLAVAIDADGVHLGQDDVPVSEARTLLGSTRLIGLSTHTPEQIEQAAGADYIGVGPVHETPTKPGRPAVGLELVRHAAARARVPFFAIGGISAANAADVRAAGAGRIAVVRALTDAADPQAAARQLRDAIATGREARVGAA
jgi:thiamine-phosphate pyrophosphorylase